MDDDARWHLLQSKLRRQRTAEVFLVLRKAEIEPILLKGIAIERFYPAGVSRAAVDIDIAVSPDHYKKAEDLRSEGKLGAFNIDIHCGLRHLDKRHWDEIYAKTLLIDINAVPVRVLCDEDLLRVACIHWLTDGGERKDRLLDIKYLIENRSREFSWENCLNADGPTRRGWVVSVIRLAKQEYPFLLDSVPFDTGCESLPVWFVSTAHERWDDEIKFAPLDNELLHKGKFFEQFKRRFPPNAIMATIALDAEIDDSTRLPLQVRYFFGRMIPSMLRTLRAVYRAYRTKR